MADFLVALAEFDRQRLWVQLGHASVFYYLHRDLKLSKGAAHFRKVAAGLIQKFPEVLAVEICPAAVVPRREVVTEVPRAPPFHPGSRPDTSVTVRPETWVTVSAHALDTN